MLSGWPTLFIRLTGCPLRCVYCDTTYSFYGGEWRTQDELLQQATASGVRHVCVTGGEPLAQKNCLALLAALCDAGFDVSLETSGALDVSQVDARVSRVVDIKTPDSGESHRNKLENLDVLTARDQVKFVLCSRADYEWTLPAAAGQEGLCRARCCSRPRGVRSSRACSPSGSSPTGSTYACRCNCTNISGAMSRDVDGEQGCKQRR